jgi:Uma2 family endonuclease
VGVAIKEHRFTVKEYRLMGEVAIFNEDDRIELIDGKVVDMAPIGWRHVWTVTTLTDLLTEAKATLGLRYFLSVQNPLALSLHGEPLPNLALIAEIHLGRLPGPEDVLLVVEVADTSLEYDRERKLPLYASAGVVEAWVVNLRDDVVEVHSEPVSGEYRSVSRRRRDGQVASATLTGLPFDVAEVLPQPSV